MFSFQVKILTVYLSNMEHDSQSKYHSMKQKRTKKQQPRSENCVTTTYLFHVIQCFAEFICLSPNLLSSVLRNSTFAFSCSLTSRTHLKHWWEHSRLHLRNTSGGVSLTAWSHHHHQGQAVYSAWNTQAWRWRHHDTWNGGSCLPVLGHNICMAIYVACCMLNLKNIANNELYLIQQ